MQTANNILLVRVPETKLDDLRALRDFVLESLVSVGLLVLPEDVTLEVMALPPLGGVTVVETGQAIPATEQPDPAAEAEGQVPSPELPAADQSEAGEKRAIVQRLKDYRSTYGRGCLEKVSEKTAHRKESRISADTLRDIAADRAPKWSCLSGERLPRRWMCWRRPHAEDHHRSGRPAGQAIGVKEVLAMEAERYGDTRVISVVEVLPEQMTIQG